MDTETLISEFRKLPPDQKQVMRKAVLSVSRGVEGAVPGITIVFPDGETITFEGQRADFIRSQAHVSGMTMHDFIYSQLLERSPPKNPPPPQKQVPSLYELFANAPFAKLDFELPEGVRSPIRPVEL